MVRDLVIQGDGAFGEAVPRSPEETLEAVTSVSRERVQQRTAEQIEDAPQYPEETLEAVTSVLRERVQQRTAEKNGEAAKIALRKRFEGLCEQHDVNEVAKVLKIVLQVEGITEVPKTASQDRRLQRTVEPAWSGRTGETRRKERGAGQ